MSGFLLDTNVISEFARPDNKPDQRVKQWLERGIEKLPQGKRRTHLEAWLEKDLHEWFEKRLLVVNEAIANRWGMLAAAAQRTGKSLAIIDGLLAATALEHKLTVVTRNSADFMSAGVPILDPWQI